MAFKKYVALATVDYLDAQGQTQVAEAAQSGKSKGVFTADLSDEQVQRLTDLGAIRPATNADLADDLEADVIEGEATEVEEALDHDGDGKKGGSKPKAKADESLLA